MRKGEEDQGAKALAAMSHVLLGGVIAVVISVVFLFLSAVAISKGLIDSGSTFRLTVAACVVGSLVGGVMAVSRCNGRALIVGLLVGVVAFLALLTLGVLIYKTVALTEGGVPLLCGSLCGGALAGLLGARPKKKRRK